MPTQVTSQRYNTNPMPLYKDMAPGLNTAQQVSNFSWTKRYATVVAAKTCLARESGTCFVTTGATTAIVFTLPVISTGPFHFEFINGADQDMTVASASVDTLVAYNDLTADSLAFSTSSEKIGGRILVDCDGTTIFATGVGHNLQHQTVAT